MAEYPAPGVHLEKAGFRPPTIVGVPTSSAALLGEAGRGPARPRLVTSLAQYVRAFGAAGPYLPAAVRGFFENGGRRVYVGRLKGPNALGRALAALERPSYDEVALLAAPGLVAPAETEAIIAHCEAMRRFAVIDCPRADPASLDPRADRESADAAAYVPWLSVKPPGQSRRRLVPPSGHVLGILARTEIRRGAWAAPGNENIQGVLGLEHAIGDDLQAVLTPRGLNAIRRFAGRGIRLWGVRTLSTDPEWKYLNIRRLFIYLERSIDKGTQWVVFEPNGESLWSVVRNQVENFLFALWRDGALQGDQPRKAFFVRCDLTTMTQHDIDSGRLIVEVGFAPLRPAEFVMFRIGQWTCDACP